MSDRLSDGEHHIGNISVDAGTCWVGDPCYVLGDDASSRVKSWSGFCDKIEKEGYYDKGALALDNGLSVIVSTGYGDGSYPVYATFKGGMCVGVRVDFDPQVDDDWGG